MIDCRICLSGFEVAGDIWRGWIVPVGGSTPDRLKVRPALPDPHSPTGIDPIGARPTQGRRKVCVFCPSMFFPLKIQTPL